MKRLLLLVCSLLPATQVLAQSIPGFTFTERVSQEGQSAPNAAIDAAQEPPPMPLTLATGTHLLIKLQSPLHTTSAVSESGVYGETVFPIIEGARVVIPAHSHVQGVVEWERRPGRVKGKARLHLSLTTLILPDQRVLSIAGAVQSVPGSSRNRKVDSEGTIEPVDQIDKDVVTIAGASAPGALLGVLGAGMPALRLGLLGAGAGIAKVLFSRGDSISLPVGSQLEIVLRRPLTVSETRVLEKQTAPAVSQAPSTSASGSDDTPKMARAD